MRIISGDLGGRRINPPAKMPWTRPTTDIAKEGLFNIIQNGYDVENAKTLDLFGGTGAITYELASRGAADLTVVEKDGPMYEFIKKTLAALSLEKSVKLIRGDVFGFITSCRDQFDLIFAGPPYALTNIDDLPRIIVDNNLIKEGGVFILEHTPRNDYKKFKGYLKERNYGTTVFSFFEAVP